MPVFSKFFDGLFFKGGILATGIICLYLSKNDLLPPYMNPLSYGMTSLGVMGLLLGLTVEEDEDEDKDPHYEERMKEFYRIKPLLEKKLREHAQLVREYEICKRRWREIDRYERDSLKLDKRMEEWKKRMQAQDGKSQASNKAQVKRQRSKTPEIPQVDSIPESRRTCVSLRPEDLAQLTKFYNVF